MKLKKSLSILSCFLLLFILFEANPRKSFCHKRNHTENRQRPIPKSIQTKFKEFKTNLIKRSIDLNLILDGGPGKNGIPALNSPSFVSQEKAKVKDKILGVLVEINNIKRFYPYDILVWHEIINDTINGVDIAVTFCPLCGPAIVFNRRMKDEILIFRVSGKLYESNMLMYDDQTESLWSQSRGEAVVEDYTGTRLKFVQMQVLRFDALKSKHPLAKALSQKTGYIRDYSLYPYGDYEHTKNLYFPVSVQDKRFPSKEIMYVFQANEKYVAIPWKDLGPKGISKIIQDKSVRVERDGGEIQVYVDDEPIPGYYEMWFSWAVHHQKNGIIWQTKNSKEKSKKS